MKCASATCHVQHSHSSLCSGKSLPQTLLCNSFLKTQLLISCVPPLPPCALQVHVQGSERTTAEVVYTINCSQALPTKEGESMGTRLGCMITCSHALPAKEGESPGTRLGCMITCSHALPAKEEESVGTRLGCTSTMHEEVVTLLSA